MANYIKCQWENCQRKAVIELGFLGKDLCAKHEIEAKEVVKEAQIWQIEHPEEAKAQFEKHLRNEMKKMLEKRKIV